MVDVPEAAGFYSALRSRRRKVKQSTEVRGSQSQQMQMENTVMNTIQQTICMKNTKSARQKLTQSRVPKV